MYSITKIYEDIYEHTKKVAGRLNDLIPKLKVQRQRDLEEDKRRFGRIEQVLVSLVSEFQTDAGKAEEITAETEQDKILYEKRKEMLDHVFDLLQKNFMGRTGRII